ncbi:hypothetical protein BCR44DRAFT_42553 [Catenaria anguillulae PL171]|uniref:Mediator of RNA polymerase II transcription subunit 5 n=1 Tax=Catenaria anguillulae PL171 TaxID=765915 RepID=A0A1Y2HI77_9FUNG|nr:hypothetical protein BCR44DRAFT_42553 [Catenaria anguillulae PL171]
MQLSVGAMEIEFAPLPPASPRQASSSQPDTASFTLIPELLQIVVSLARARSCIPAACSEIASLCTNGRDVQFSWRNHLLFGPFTLDNGAQLTRFAALLKSMLPTANPGLSVFGQRLAATGFAPTGFAPTTPLHPDPIFTPQYLCYLFKHVHPHQQKVSEQGSASHYQTFKLGHGPALSPLPRGFNWWMPISHGYLLPVYLLRAASSGTPHVESGRPWTSWRDLGLNYFDDRVSTALFFHRFWFARDREPVPFPLLLATFALFEWSLPSLQLVLRHFPAYSPLDIVQHASAKNGDIFNTMVLQLSQVTESLPDCPDRIISMYQWLDSLNVPYLPFPLIGVISDRASLEYLKQVLIQVDVPKVRAASAAADQELMPGLVSLRARLVQMVVSFTHRVRLIIFFAHDDSHCCHTFLMPILDSLQGLKCALDNAQPSHTSAPPSVQTVTELARMLRSDFGVDLRQLIVDDEIRLVSGNVALLLTALNDTTLRLDPIATLQWAVSLLEDSPMDLSEHHKLESLCVTLTFTYHASSESRLDDEIEPIHVRPDYVRTLPRSHFAILLAAMVVATARADPSLNRFLLPFELQVTTLGSLITHAIDPHLAHCASPPTRHSFFTNATPSLRATLATTLRDLSCIHSCEIKELDQHTSGNLRDPKFAEWLLLQLAALDPWFVAAALDFCVDPGVMGCVLDLVPEKLQACSRASRWIVAMVSRDREREVAEEWISLRDEGASKEGVQRMVGWMIEAARYSGQNRDQFWTRLQEKVNGIVDGLS